MSEEMNNNVEQEMDLNKLMQVRMEKLEELINNTQKMIEIQTNAKKLVKYDATKDIVNQIKEVRR